MDEELARDLRALHEGFEREKEAVLAQHLRWIDTSLSGDGAAVGNPEADMAPLLTACGGNLDKLGKYTAMLAGSNGDLEGLGRLMDSDRERQEGDLLTSFEEKRTLLFAGLERELASEESQQRQDLDRNLRQAEGEVARMQADLAAERARLLEEAKARRQGIEEGMVARLESARQECKDVEESLSLSLRARLIREAAEAPAASVNGAMEQVARSLAIFFKHCRHTVTQAAAASDSESALCGSNL